jgi:pre-rRNA-processing protein TSR4
MTPIQLAFIIDDKNNQLPRLISQVNSIPNKVGGLPIWLDPYHPLGGADCSECKLSMPLLAQLYCPEDYPENAFHRVIYVFCCRNGRCHKGQKNAFAVFRSQLPLHNKLYDIDGFWIKPLAVEDFILKAEDVATHTGYCRLCGKLGTSVCGNCRKARYCSKEHQKLDWKQGLHYEYCESPDSPPAVINDWITSFQFPEYELAEDEEPARKLDELQKDIEDKLIVEADDKYLVEEEETQTDVDKVFLKFQKRISLAPSQVLRFAIQTNKGTEG